MQKPEDPKCVSAGAASYCRNNSLETLGDRLKQILVGFLGEML